MLFSLVVIIHKSGLFVKRRLPQCIEFFWKSVFFRKLCVDRCEKIGYNKNSERQSKTPCCNASGKVNFQYEDGRVCLCTVKM